MNKLHKCLSTKYLHNCTDTPAEAAHMHAFLHTLNTWWKSKHMLRHAHVTGQIMHTKFLEKMTHKAHAGTHRHTFYTPRVYFQVTHTYSQTRPPSTIKTIDAIRELDLQQFGDFLIFIGSHRCSFIFHRQVNGVHLRHKWIYDDRARCCFGQVWQKLCQVQIFFYLEPICVLFLFSTRALCIGTPAAFTKWPLSNK